MESENKEINALNFMSILNKAVSELTLAHSRLQDIEMDTPSAHEALQEMNGQVILASELMPQIIE